MSYYYSDYSTRAHQEPDTGRHPVNVGHLVMGLAFLGLAAVWAMIQLDVVPDDNIRWLLPLPWVIAGAAGLLAGAVGSGSRRRRRQAAAVAERRANPGIGSADLPADLVRDETSDIDEELSRETARRDAEEER